MSIEERNVYLEDIPMGEAKSALWQAIVEVGKDAPLSAEKS
jgi:hypothetical protein